MRDARPMLAVLLCAMLGGCAAPPFKSWPAPVRTYVLPVGVADGEDADFAVARSQAIVRGRRAITVAHGFDGSFWGFQAPYAVFRDGSVPIAVAGMGSFSPLAADETADAMTQRDLDEHGQDWLAFEAEEPLDGGAPVDWKVSTVEPAWGERLYVVCETPAGRFERVPLRRVKARASTLEFPDNVYVTIRRGGFDMAGWSGSFVGRRVAGRWELVGMIVAVWDGDGDASNGREVAFIVRPPEAALRWLMGEDVTLPNTPPPLDP